MKLKTAALLLLTVIISLGASAQDFESLFDDLPGTGCWAEYKLTKTSANGPVVSTMRVSVTRSETVGGQEYFLVELYPFSFKAVTRKTGTIGLLMKKNAIGKEKGNFVLRTKKLMFAPDGKEPFEVEEALLEDIRGASNDVVFKKRITEKERTEMEFPDGVRRRVTTCGIEMSTESADGSKIEVNEQYTGTITLCADIPFGIVREELLVRKYDRTGTLKKEKTITTELQRFGTKGAKSAFPEGKLKKKGIWGIIFS